MNSEWMYKDILFDNMEDQKEFMQLDDGFDEKTDHTELYYSATKTFYWKFIHHYLDMNKDMRIVHYCYRLEDIWSDWILFTHQYPKYVEHDERIFFRPPLFDRKTIDMDPNNSNKLKTRNILLGSKMTDFTKKEHQMDLMKIFFPKI